MERAGDAQREIRQWFDAALKVVDPRDAVRTALHLEGDGLSVGGQRLPLSRHGSVIVIAIGKAACGLARGVSDVLGDRVDRGIILTKYGHVDGPVGGFGIYEASHPTPDQAGLDATASILGAVGDLSEDDLAIALISGGGSSLLELPREGISLADMQDVTRLLMHAGAGINDLNTVRKALSQVKGGGLRARIGPARCVTLLLSDVLGNDPSIIASGPTVASATGPADALEVISRFGVAGRAPGTVIDLLRQDGQALPEVDTSGDVVHVIADNALFVNQVATEARSSGLRVRVDGDPYDGDAAQLGRAMVETLGGLPVDVDAYVRGGEATVAVTGDGAGGRNTEMALVAALALDGSDQWVVASLASDGDDGNSGAAGAIVDGGTVSRARAAGLDLRDALRRNDSASVFRAIGGLVETGPTGTNVNDAYIAVRLRHVDPGEEQGMSSGPLMLDVDTGVDDAAAIAFALGMEADLVGVTTVAGNVPIDFSTDNTLRVLSLLGAEDVPVFRGASRPLVAEYQDATHVHGGNGLGGADIPEPLADEQELTAPEAIVAMAEEFDGELTFVSVGPMTNLAMALSLRPRIVEQIARVVIMGGSYFNPGNITPYAEFNAYVDPDALDQVFAAHWNEIYAIGLDVTHQTALTEAMWAGIPAKARGSAGLIRAISERTFRERVRSGFFLHDPLALAVALDPTLVGVREMAVSVRSQGDERGRTVVSEGGRVKVAESVDAERFVRTFCNVTGISSTRNPGGLANAE